MAEATDYDYVNPVTIVPDRYGGSFSGGRWLAFPVHPWELTRGPFRAESLAAEWWETARSLPIGVGDAPESAYAALLNRLEEMEPAVEVPPTSPLAGWVLTWELEWPDGETTTVDRSWRGAGTRPPSHRHRRNA